MPGLDGTGPQGAGSNTGRGMGNCGQSGVGRGFGIGRGFGRFGRRFFGCIMRQNISQNNMSNKEMLNEEEKILENELKAVREEKKNLENDK